MSLRYVIAFSLLFLLVSALSFLFLFTEDHFNVTQGQPPQMEQSLHESKTSRASYPPTEATVPDVFSDSAKIPQLLVSLAGLNTNDQKKTAQTIADLSNDEAAKEWSDLIIRDALPLPATQVLFKDMRNRPPELLQPFLARMADLSSHPLHNASVEALEFIYDQPPSGQTWTSWVKAKLDFEAGRK